MSGQRYARAMPPVSPSASPARRGRFAALVLGAVLVALGLTSPAALGFQTHGFQFSFDGTGSSNGAFTDLGSVAVHQPTGNVFAIDRTNGVIDKFDAAGSPQNFSALGSSSIHVEATCPGFQFPPLPKPGYGGYYHGRDDIAVSSAGPTNGNIYVATDSVDPGAPEGTTPEICAYDSAGNFLWRDSEFPGNGLTVDTAGHLWIGSFGAGAVELETTGSPPEVEAVVSAFGAERIAVGTIENIFLTNYYSGGQLERWNFVALQSIVQPGPTGAMTVDNSNNHLYATVPGEFREYNAETNQILSSAGEDVVNFAGGIAVRESTGDVYLADNSKNRIFVFGPLDTFAAVNTGPATNVRRTTSGITGNVDPDGGGTVTNCHVEYGLDKSYGSSVPCNQATPFSSAQAITADISGLTGGTTYHYRVFASDAAGQNKGKDQTFTTPYVSGVNTEAASNLDRTSATLNGALDPDGLNTSFYFQWGLTVGYGNTQPAGPPGESVGSAPGNKEVSASISGLELATVYHYRIVAINSTGKTVGEDRTFTTHPPIKDLSTTAPSDVGPDSATLNGSLDPDGFDTHYYFEWGRDTSYGNVTPAAPGTDAGSTSGATPVSASISGLDDYTKYHYRVIATNSFGTTIGNDVEFLSGPPFLPQVSSSKTVSVTDSGATVSAMVNPGFGPTVYRFQYGRDVPYSSRTALSNPIGEDGADHLVTVTIGGLQPSTTYHFRAVATNFSGSTGGEDITFVTAAPPGLDAVTSSDVTRTSARLHAQIAPNSSPTTFHFEYGTGTEYGQRTPESGSIGADNLGHTVASDVGGLAPGSTYHFRVVATNEYGTVIGADQTFTTQAPAVSATPPVECKHGFKLRHGECVKAHKKHKKRRHHRHARRSK